MLKVIPWPLSIEINQLSDVSDQVFLARQQSMQRLVALKISADKGTEPQTLAQLDHDYIVRVFAWSTWGVRPAGCGQRLTKVIVLVQSHEKTMTDRFHPFNADGFALR